MLAQSCPTLCDPMDSSPPGSFVHGIFQARIVEWIAISYSRGSSWPKGWTCISYIFCIGKQIVYHCSTREAQIPFIYCRWKISFFINTPNNMYETADSFWGPLLPFPLLPHSDKPVRESSIPSFDAGSADHTSQGQRKSFLSSIKAKAGVPLGSLQAFLNLLGCYPALSRKIWWHESYKLFLPLCTVDIVIFGKGSIAHYGVSTKQRVFVLLITCPYLE